MNSERRMTALFFFLFYVIRDLFNFKNGLRSDSDSKKDGLTDTFPRKTEEKGLKGAGQQSHI